MKMKSLLHKTNLFVRSLLFSISMIVITVPFSFICIAAHLTLPLRYRCAMIAWWTGTMVASLKFFCNVNYDVEGLDNIPKDRNGIILSKHQSTWETFYLQSIFPDTAIILKRELKWVPFFGWGLAITNPIAINRSDKSSAMNQIFEQGQKCLDDGRWVLVFPEGTRIPPGSVGIYKKGGAKLAVHTGYPVIPVAHNAGRYWSKRSFIKKPGTIKVAIGPMIESKGRSPDDVLEEAKTWIETTILRIDDQR
jgi:1-acyl-sn-glycerol-3-phosphate acyltransferase